MRKSFMNFTLNFVYFFINQFIIQNFISSHNIMFFDFTIPDSLNHYSKLVYFIYAYLE
jgi:hypothetical protein